MSADIDTFLSQYPPDIRLLAAKTRHLIHTVLPGALEMIDPPANLIGYGINRSYKGLICGITLHKDHINLMFARGTTLPDPQGLLQGTGKRARHVPIQHLGEIEAPAVRNLLKAALQFKEAVP